MADKAAEQKNDNPGGNIPAFNDNELYEKLKSSLEEVVKDRALTSLKKVLVLPPDYTRLYSGAGKITAMYYSMLKEFCRVDIMPALGTHEKMSQEECKAFFGDDIPYESILVHRWREDVVKIGEVPATFVNEVSEGLVNEKIDVEINKILLDKSYDAIISIGQVVPHEVVGMANYSKNIFVGCGGSNMINSSHMLGAFYGMERVMGKDFSPVRRVFDYAQEHFLKDLPLLYVLTVTTNTGDETNIHGLFTGKERKCFEQAVALSQKLNMTKVDKPFEKCVVYLDEREFKSTWLGNKAIYRTRMAMKTGGELIILAPGVSKFGEDKENDRLIRKYGYIGRENILKKVNENEDLKNNLSVAAHLIHGSSDGRFNITYCTEKLSRQQIESAGFKYIPFDEAIKIYNPKELKDGINYINGEEIFYVSNPALGLWECENR